jgi:hypothetical protein
MAARWLLRFLEEHPDPTIEEAGLAASSLRRPVANCLRVAENESKRPRQF